MLNEMARIRQERIEVTELALAKLAQATREIGIAADGLTEVLQAFRRSRRAAGPRSRQATDQTDEPGA